MKKGKRKVSGLTKHIENIYRLESSVYQQQALIEKLTEDLSELPSNKPSNTIGCLGPLLGSIFGIVLCMLPFVLDISIVWKLLLGIFLLPMGAGVTISAIGGLFESVGEYASTADERYNARLEYYEGVERRKVIEQELPVLQEKLEETELLLQEYYDQGVVFPKYRNLVAISSIYEYLLSERCVGLTGPDGAYNIFEREIRQDIIIAQLEEVLDQLQQIKQNQFALYDAIQRSTRITKRIYAEMMKLTEVAEAMQADFGEEMERLGKNMVVANYIAELTRKEIEYRNYLDHHKTYLNQ